MDSRGKVTAVSTGQRRFLLLAAGLTGADLLVGVFIRHALVTSREAAGWILQPLALYGHTEHVGARLSPVVLVAAISVPILVWKSAVVVRLLPPVAVIAMAVAMAGAASNAVEVLLRGAATDYLAFRHLPLVGNDLYNLADVEIYLGGAIAVAWLLPFVMRQPTRR